MGYTLFGLLEIKEKEKGERRRELHTHRNKRRKREVGAGTFWEGEAAAGSFGRRRTDLRSEGTDKGAFGEGKHRKVLSHFLLSHTNFIPLPSLSNFSILLSISNH